MTQIFKEKAFMPVMTLIATGAAGWCSWVTIQVVNRPTYEHVREIVKVESPYNEDRKLVMQTLNDVREVNKLLRTAIDNNTRAIERLNVLIDK